MHVFARYYDVWSLGDSGRCRSAAPAAPAAPAAAAGDLSREPIHPEGLLFACVCALLLDYNNRNNVSGSTQRTATATTAAVCRRRTRRTRTRRFFDPELLPAKVSPAWPHGEHIAWPCAACAWC